MLDALDLELANLLQYDPAYEWRGGNAKLIESRDREVIAEGPAETGKTWAACYKTHMACREYPGAQFSLIRKVRATIYSTVFLTMKRVIGNFPVTYYGGTKEPEAIIYPNGSTIWLGGMDKAGKTLSGERDGIQVCQAEELNQDDWETLTTRITGRGAVMPYTQIFGDCNPGGSKHHLRQRAKSGVLRMLPTKHTDNPSLYTSDGVLTEQGKRTMETLDNLTGIRRKRLRDGIWATAEGAVYEDFDASIHVRMREWSEFKSWYLAEDEGFTNPSVILLVGEDNDKRHHIFREFYKRGVLQSRVVERTRRFMSWVTARSIGERKRNGVNPTEAKRLASRISLVAVDEAAAGLIADLRNNGVPAKGTKGRVLDRISSVQNRLRVRADGLPRLSIDPSCTNTINDFESRVWKPEKDEPVKDNDHGTDAYEYLDNLIGDRHPNPRDLVDSA
jgi:PBSX family phage terminase large subunit